MRTLLIASTATALLGVCAFLGGQSPSGPAKVRVRLVDASTGKPTAGLVRAFRAADREGKPLPLPGLFDRMRGLGKASAEYGWHVVPREGGDLTLPREKVRLEALAGLETALASAEVDPGVGTPGGLTLKLPAVFDPGEHGLVAGNTHLHLRGSALDGADEYLRQVPPADRLAVVFTSYLERHKDDRDYITNRYPVGDLKRFAATGVLFNHGEEHRHNFEAYGQGYGHVMFLDIDRLVRPVSLGPGITGGGNDDRPLRPGIDDARGQKGTVIWCHNTNGHEDVPSVLAGRVHALNVFDGSRTGRYEDGYYHYLNIGLRLPISTGTDWFIYDFARVYARPEGKPSIRGWLGALRQGRNCVTNGPLLQLLIDGKEPGGVLNLEGPKTVRVEANAVGRLDFGKLQLVHDGRVIQEADAKTKGPGYAASFARELRVPEAGWLALRVAGDARNEMGHSLFAHTSPLYIDIDGKRRFDLGSARTLLRQVEEGQADIRRRGTFSGEEARAGVLALYDEAARDLRERIRKRGG